MCPRSLAGLVGCLLLIAGCHDSEAPLHPPGDDGNTLPVPQSLALEPPAALAARMPPQNPFLFNEGRYLHAGYALEQFAGRRASAVLHQAVLSPVTSPGAQPTPADVALLLCGMEMTGYTGDSTVTLCWQAPSPAPERIFLGLGNFVQDRWDWCTAPAQGPFRLPALQPYINDHGRLVLAVVLVGDQPARLEGVQIGARWVVRATDMSLLCAPVMRFESAALEADWATRSPVAADFEVVAEATDPDGTQRFVVSHRVDGYRHYGAVVVPATRDTEQRLPVLVMCHPAAGGIVWDGEAWFFGMLDDPSLRQRFVLVVPSFRGETLVAGLLGSFSSEGSMSVFDRDADDAIALLDCTVQNFPQADPNLALSTGWSRGGQVALRIAQRDPRIRGVVEFCGMSDEWTLNGQGYMRDFLSIKQPEPSPVDFYYHALWAFHRGDITVWEARSVLLRSCIVYQAARLPKVQMHYGVLDPVVPIHEGDRLAAELATLPNADYEYYRYPYANHSPTTMLGAGTRAEAFLRSFLTERPH